MSISLSVGLEFGLEWCGFSKAVVSRGFRVASLLAVGLALAACGEPAGEAASGPPPLAEVPPATSPRDAAVLEVAGMGEIRIELLGDLAPLTVGHFVQLAESGGYDGTTFHRVVPGFMIQGGDPNTRDRDPRNDGRGGLVPIVPDERPALSFVRGMVGLANRGAPNTGAAQFFILVADEWHLDGKHAAFGRVTSGMDVVDRIVAVERDQYGRYGPEDRPLHDVVVKHVRIERAQPGRVP